MNPLMLGKGPLRQLPRIHERLKNVAVIHTDAVNVLQKRRQDPTFIYLDPPYLPETRVSKNSYEFEFTYEQHEELLREIQNHDKVLISGYDSDLYNKYLKGWLKIKKDIANHSGQTKSKTRREEILWRNY